jgi:hypothetical protein
VNLESCGRNADISQEFAIAKNVGGGTTVKQFPRRIDISREVNSGTSGVKYKEYRKTLTMHLRKGTEHA